MADQWFDDIRQYLPKYLSAEAGRDLFGELSQFPDNIDQRLYTTALEKSPSLYQGDGLRSVWISNLPDPAVKQARVMVLSNTCDIALENHRYTSPRLVYCPIVKFSRYAELLIEGGASGQLIEDIRRQRVSSMFYLPATAALEGEGVALLDRVTNCDLTDLDTNTLTDERLFTLSDYGFYLFLFKLSIHFTRIRENVQRN